ncbi:MAG TPA: sulfite exporter TauE/SafE family protein [Pseudolabrys sp.]|nr:sulfite exporter TauE/SafE family protein [Pseudolabrys sp.]
MDLHLVAMLAGVGVLAGMIASIVGGAAVVVYPALIASGLSPQFAAASNLVALMPATMLAALSDRSQLPPFNRAFVELVFASVTGAGAGAILLMLTPGRVFEIIVPVLLGFATVIFALADRIGAHIRKRAAHKGREVEFDVSSLKVLLPVSFYGGYFGAGVGVLILAVFSIATGGDYRSANVAKNFVSSLNAMVASGIFIAEGAVAWPQTLSLMAGMIAGGLAGAYVARIIPAKVARGMIVLVGAALTIVFAKLYWFD